MGVQDERTDQANVFAPSPLTSYPSRLTRLYGQRHWICWHIAMRKQVPAHDTKSMVALRSSAAGVRGRTLYPILLSDHM